jgi:hypothetical protein
LPLQSDALGHSHHIFTPLAAYIVDTPKSAALAGIGRKTSSVTMENYKQFGDSFQHEPRTTSTTLMQFSSVEKTVKPWDLEVYVKSVFPKFCLNGVQPFWRDWPLAQHHQFLTLKLLHHWHNMFWDHNIK